MRSTPLASPTRAQCGTRTTITSSSPRSTNRFRSISRASPLRSSCRSTPSAWRSSPWSPTVSGGAAGGEEASRLAVGAITRYVTQAIHCYYSEDAMDEQRFPRALESAALRVHEDIQRNSPTGPLQAYMATTLTLWIGVWPRAYLLQVGDSRCYLLRNGELMQLSRDQTLAQALVDRGVFRCSDTLSSPFSNVLSSALGGRQAAPIGTHMQREWGSVGLLCSDGLAKHVPDSRIRERLLAMTSAKQVCEDLLRDALDAGGTDNVTVLVGRTLRKDPS